MRPIRFKMFRFPEFPNNWPRNALATTVIVLFCFMVIWVFTSTYPEANARIVYFLGGQVTGFVGTIINFHFSSTEDQRNREQIAVKKETD